MMGISVPPEVYAYFKVHASQQKAAEQAVADFQAQLQSCWPHSEARCLWRDEGSAHRTTLTLMEIYRWDTASDGADGAADWLTRVLAGPAALGPILVGTRHVERFKACA